MDEDNSQPNAEIANTTEALTLDRAAALLGRASQDRSRGTDGRFSAPETAETVAEDDPASKIVDIKTGKAAETSAEQKAATEGESEDDYFEFPPEKEGDEPRRVKLDEVLAAYEELPKLKTELETVRQSPPMPADYQSALQDTVRARANYLRGLEVVASLINPTDPPLAMLDRNSEKYDPDQYYALKAQAEHDRARLKTIQTERQSAQQRQEEENNVLLKAALAREVAALEKSWPEFKSMETRRGVAQGLKDVYGFKPEEIDSIADHRQLLVIRDALELRALKAKQAEAVKVVRQKPKLVKGAARTTTNPSAAKGTAALQNLQQSGSVDAAVAAMRALKL